MPNATDISVLEVVQKFDAAPFQVVANAVANGEFSFWVGSGISRNAPSLGGLIDRAIEFVRVRAVDPITESVFLPVLEEVLVLARVEKSAVAANLGIPFVAWPQSSAIRDELWTKYSDLLDIRVQDEEADYVLWDAVNIREAFTAPPLPDAPHLCIGVLIMEGAVRSIASGNWDGFIEAAVDRLTAGAPGILQVVVDPDHLRDPAARARLLKFHGCIVHADQQPALYRKFLTGSHTQIVNWPNNPDFAAIRSAVTELASNSKSLVLGLSVQDANLQGVFSAASHMHPWPWPCNPAAQAHVFCEDHIKPGQRSVLRIVYGANYNSNMAAIEQSAHLRAWGEQVLIALVFNVIEKKLCLLMELWLAEIGKTGFASRLATVLKNARNLGAEQAVDNRTDFVYRAISLWSRALALYRNGALQDTPDTYQELSASTPIQLPTDQNAKAAGLGRLGAAIGLLQSGHEDGRWRISAPQGLNLTDGAMTKTSAWVGAEPRPLFLVKSVTEAINLEKNGAFAGDKAIVLHGDDTYQRVFASGTTARRPRGAPGRNGRSSTRHVSISHLIETSVDADDLIHRFSSEVAL